MGCGYRCPNQHRARTMGFLLCKAYMKDGEDYNVKENAMKAICAYQYYCPRTKRQENTKCAKECYSRQTAKK